MKKLTLLQRFAMVTLMVMIAVALVFGYLVNHILEVGLVENRVKNTHDMVRSNFIRHFRPEALHVPKTGEDYELFSHEMKHLSLVLGIQRIKVWNRNMEVVWSADRQLVGRTFPHNNELKRALAGETVLIAKDKENIKDKYQYTKDVHHVVKLFLPIQYGAREDINVVVELYKNVDPFMATITRHKHEIWVWTCIFFFIFYLFLFGWFRKASRRINLHTGDLTTTVEKLKDEIGEREHTERLLKRASKEWRKIFDSTRDMIIMLDNTLTILRTNKATITFFNKSFEEVLGKHVSYLLDYMTMSDREHSITAIMQSRHHEETEMYFEEKNVWVAISVDPIMDNQGGVTGAVLLIRDKTELKKMQDSMVTAKNDWEDTFNTITDMITIHDRDFNIIRSNRAAREMFHLPDTDTIESIKCFKYYHGTDMPPVRCPSCKCLKTGKFASFERYEPHLDRFVEIRAIPRFNHENEIIGTIHIVRDITDVKTAREEKNKLKEQLLHVQKMDSIGRLAGGVAHDFNNILSVIIGYSELALKELSDESHLRDTVAAIHGAGEKAAALTRKLLAFSRKQVLEMRAVDMERVMENMTKMLERLIPENVTLVFDSETMGKKVLADPTQMEQILMNLAVNARDAMPDGGRLKINTSAVDFDERQGVDKENLKPGSYLMLSVSDTGIGMEKDVQDRIFEPFFSTKEVGKGTGMGLATVYGIVKQHNGYIEVRSEPGKGSIFSIYLPVAEGEADVVAEDKTERVLTGEETILVVDDEPMIRDIVTGMLTPLGYRVFGAANAEEALQISDEFSERIDLLLTDVIMPGMHGKKLAKTLTGNRPDTKVIFMSGYTDDAIAHHGVLEDGVVLIQKPITEKTLASKVREVLDSDRELQAVCLGRENAKDLQLLIADDNEDIRKLLSVYLKRYDCAVDTAENGRVAVDKCKSQTYDIVFMDMEMPVMNGMSAMQEIRNWEREKGAELTTIIALTGNASPEDISCCMEAGFTSHLAKPISRDQFVDAIFSFAPSRNEKAQSRDNSEGGRVVAHVDSDLKELIPEYLAERHNDVRRIQEAIKTADYETVRILGHTLKGSGGGYGFEAISEMGIHIEQAAKEGNEEIITRCIVELLHYLENVEVIFE